MYLKALGIHIYLATIKKSYFVNGKYFEANAKALYALKSTLNDEYLFRVFNFDSAFVHSHFSWGTNAILRGETRILEVILPTCATWSKGMTPLR